LRADPELWGVCRGFRDVTGAWREAPAETVEAVLDAMGAEGEPPPPAAITLRPGADLQALGPGVVLLEEGGERPLGPGLPFGYHRLQPDEGGEPVRLVVSPGVAPLPRRRQWGFSAQLYATRTKRSWGVGDLGDLGELGSWAAGEGAAFTLVNPLHAATPSVPQEPSPYFPGSRCFTNPLYIAVEDVPGAEALPGLEELAAAARRLNDRRLIDRDAAWELKSAALERLHPLSAGDPAFDAYLAERGRPLQLFASFCAFAEVHGAAWRQWPAALRHPSGPAVASFAAERRERVRYHAWLQWVLDRQLAAASERLGVVADLAVGVDPSGPDSWIWQDSFAPGMRVGAPPDEFNTLGQDWGLPPFDPWGLRSAAYEPWVEALRAGFRHGAGLRVDHVMGLFRLYWLREGADARAGVYVRYPHEDLLNILALEAHRAGAFVVGEDLGTVEDEVRHELGARQVCSYRVWWFEDSSPAAWPEAALGAVSTHDLPTVAGVYSGSDLEAQRRLGMEPNEESSAALRRKLVERTGAAPGDPVEDVVAGVYRDLARAPCALLCASLDDALAVEERPNMPGTTGGSWPNWSLALPVPLEEIRRRELPRRVAAELRRATGP
jgi:4-alpha-glucanotransferase